MCQGRWPLNLLWIVSPVPQELLRHWQEFYLAMTGCTTHGQKSWIIYSNFTATFICLFGHDVPLHWYGLHQTKIIYNLHDLQSCKIYTHVMVYTSMGTFIYKAVLWLEHQICQKQHNILLVYELYTQTSNYVYMFSYAQTSIYVHMLSYAIQLSLYTSCASIQKTF